MTESDWLTGENAGPMFAFVTEKLSERKRQLFISACIGRFWKRIASPAGRERAAAGGPAVRATAIGALSAALPFLFSPTFAVGSLTSALREELAEASRLLREIVGNPFRPVRVEPAWLKWNDGVVVKMGKAIDDAGRYADLPILADALEDAGCDNADLLSHCRTPGGHAAGCWAVDLLLGKE
jgi:hypothetical protein